MTAKAKFRIEGEDATAAAFRSALGGAQSTASRMSGLFRTAFAGISVAAIVGVASRAIEMGDELNKAAIKAGIGGKAISELAHAAKMADIDLGSLSTALKKMQVNLSEAATGGKTQKEALDALGLSFKELQGLGADQQFERIAEQISRLKDPADKARAATELFGKAGADLLPLFEKGAAGIRAAREEAQKLGKSFTDEQIKALAEADDAIKRMKASWEGFATSLTAKVAPAITRVLDSLNSISKKGLASKEGSLLQMGLTNPLFGLAGLGMGMLGGDGATARPGSRGGALGSNSGGADAIGFQAAKKAEQALAEVRASGLKMQRAWIDEYYDSLDDRTKTSSEKQREQLAGIKAGLYELRDAGLISAKTFDERWSAAFDNLDGELEEVATNQKRMTEDFIGFWDEMPDRAQEASMRAYDAFDEFFFDPAKDGIMGLAKGLVDSLRKSISSGLTDKLFGSKKSGGFGLGDAISGFGKSLFGFANGGSFQVGGSGGTDSQLVAFRASPNERVSITKPGQGGGGVTIIQNNDLRGSTPDMMKQLPAILAHHAQQTVQMARMAVRDDMSRGAI